MSRLITLLSIYISTKYFSNSRDALLSDSFIGTFSLKENLNMSSHLSIYWAVSESWVGFHSIHVFVGPSDNNTLLLCCADATRSGAHSAARRRGAAVLRRPIARTFS